MVRVFQAMQDTRTAFRLYVVENGINIFFGVLLVGPLGVRGLALSLSIAYTLAALLAMAVVRQRVGGLGGDDLTTPVKRVLAASAAMGVATVIALNISGAASGFGLLARVVAAVVVGTVAYGAAAGLLAARASAAAHSPTRRPARRALGAGWSGGPAPVADRRRPPASPDAFHGRLDDHARRCPSVTCAR